MKTRFTIHGSHIIFDCVYTGKEKQGTPAFRALFMLIAMFSKQCN